MKISFPIFIRAFFDSVVLYSFSNFRIELISDHSNLFLSTIFFGINKISLILFRKSNRLVYFWRDILFYIIRFV